APGGASFQRSRGLRLILAGVAALLIASLALADARSRALLANTFRLAGLVECVALPLGVLLAAALVRTNLPGRRTALAILACLLWPPLYLQAGAWQSAFGFQGWLPLVWGGPAWLTGWTGAVVVHAAALVPWVVLFVGAGLYLVEADLEEQALLDLSPTAVFFRVTLHRAGPAIVAAALWGAVVCGSEMTVTDLFQIRTYAEELYTQFAVNPLPIAVVDDLPPPSASFVAQLAPGAALCAALVVAAAIASSGLAPVLRRGPRRRRFVYELGSLRLPAAAAVWGCLFVIAGVPLLSLLYQCGATVERHGDELSRTWSAIKCVRLVAECFVRWDDGPIPGRFAAELVRSFVVAASAAALATGLAAALVWFARRGGARAVPALLVLAAALAIPGPLTGLIATRCFNRPEFPALIELYDHSIVPLVLVQIPRSLPPAMLLLWPALASLPQESLDLASLDGLSTFARWRKVIVPQRWLAFLAAFAAAMAGATAELGASLLVAPPGFDLVSVRAFNLLHFGVDDLVASLYLALLTVLLFAAALVAWAQKKTHRGPA
ncbi:MAG TPA: ABC transporter permease subunit, partial [Pirellulales bacterium]